MCQLPPEKPCANEPKPPRVTPPEPESDDVPDEEWLEESLLYKPEREDQWEVPPDELLLQFVVCAAPGTVAPGGVASQLRCGVSV
jgi:hypothetical protein